MTLLALPDPGDDGVVEHCGESPRLLCEITWKATHNETLAGIADWFVQRPFTIVSILAGTWIVTRIFKGLIRRTAYRIVMTDPELGKQRIARITRLRRDEGESTGDPGDLGVLIRDPRRHARATSISTVLGSTVTVAAWTVALILVLGQLSIDLAPIIAGAGIAGVALGFGAQSLVKDCLSGLFMLIEDQYGIGDVIDLGEASGVVERISLRATVLRGLDGTVWHVPNGVVERVGNKSQRWSVAVIDVDVTYDADLTRVQTLIHQAADAVCASQEYSANVLEAPEVLGVEALAADGITIRLTVKTTPGVQWRIQRALRQRIKETFDEHGIEIPFPQRTVWMRMQGETRGEEGGEGIGMT